MLGIAKFAGVKRIVTLAAFPLAYHSHRNKIKASLVERGRRFVSLLGVHYLQYYRNAFMGKGEAVEVPVKGRIKVDAAFFRENNPNYVRPCISGLTEKKSLNDGWFTLTPENKVRSNGTEQSKMEEGDLLLCSPTVRDWSFGNKIWLEFAVDDISNIVWNPSSFANLAIPSQKKQLILALAQAHLGKTSDHMFDNFVVSARELGHEPKKLEDLLSHISQLAYHWKALVLLDEADIFVQARSIDIHQNAHVSGIMFLTTNRVRDFDDAIQSRITLAVRYEPLRLATRKQVWASFLKKAVTANGAAKYNPEDLDELARKDLNGRQLGVFLPQNHNQDAGVTKSEATCPYLPRISRPSPFKESKLVGSEKEKERFIVRVRGEV
ncbi:MAG: hypothetical protein LQ341_006356 [Variospora aurantia]|nr:MAG: hypothetical protein LQ341_006356 [Variospora aurantia]